MRIGLVFVLGMALVIGGCTMNSGDSLSRLQSKALESGHAPVKGIAMYYEVHGRRGGIPLVLPHGGGSTIDVAFSRVLPVLPPAGGSSW